MKIINVFDFDDTIYDGDCSIDFYLFCVKKNLSLIKYLPIQLYGLILYYLRIKKKEFFKEKYFSFIKGVKNINLVIEAFWKENRNKIKYNLISEKSSIIVISASPEFLLKPICEEIGVERLIATKVNEKTGKFESKNCYGEEKVNRLNKEYKEYKIQEFYSDSKSDIYLANIAKKSFLVKKCKVLEWK